MDASVPCDKPNPVSFAWPLALIVLATGLLRLVFVDLYPTSFDEIFTRYWIEQPMAFLWGEGWRIETNPPLHYALLRLWALGFGFSDASLRIPSILAWAGTTVACGLIGRRAGGTAGGLLAAGLYGIAPFPFWNALEARPVALTPLFQAVTLHACFDYLARFDAAGGPAILSWRERAAPLAAFVLSAVASAYTHVTAVPFVAAAGLAVVGTILLDRRGRRSELLAWFGAGALVILLCLPLLLIMLDATERSGLEWLPQLSLWTVQAFLSAVMLGVGAFEGGTALRLSGLAVLGLITTIGALGLRSRAARVVLVVVPALFLTMLLAISLVRTLLVARYALILAVPLCVLLAVGILRLPLRVPRLLAAAAAVVPLGLGSIAQLRDPVTLQFSLTPARLDYRGVARFLAGNEQCRGDIHSGHIWTLLGWPHYGPRPRDAGLYWVLFPGDEPVAALRNVAGINAQVGAVILPLDEFQERMRAARAATILVSPWAPSSPAMLRLIETLEGDFAMQRHSFGTGYGTITVICLARREHT